MITSILLMIALMMEYVICVIQVFSPNVPDKDLIFTGINLMIVLFVVTIKILKDNK